MQLNMHLPHMVHILRELEQEQEQEQVYMEQLVPVPVLDMVVVEVLERV